MIASEKNTFGDRLKSARKMQGYSLQGLADALEGKVSKQTLSKYEKGAMSPSGEVLMAIASALKVKPDYFLKKEQVQLGEVLFRKKARLSKKDEEAIVEQVRDYVERFLEVEFILGIKHSFKNPLEDVAIEKWEDVEKAARFLRASWDLGSDPIPNLVEMLELHGIKVCLQSVADEFDGLAVCSSEGVPIVAINTKNKPTERLRFTIIHELAHLLLQFSDEIEKDEKLVEKYCHRFATCFLIPTEHLLKLIGENRTYIKIAELISIKEYYGISIRAIVYRLKDLGVISQSYYQRWMVYMNKEYGSKNEPGHYGGEEKPKMFNLLVNRALAEELISISKAAALWNVSINQVRKGFGGV